MNLHTKRRLKAGVALLCSATMTFALATPYSFADEKETLENKTSDLQSQLAGINQDLLKISDEISDTQMRVTIVNSEILRSEDELTISQQNEDQQYENMKSRIKYMYENGNSNMLELLFSAESMSDFLNKADFIQNISQYDRDMLSELQNIHADIENQKMALQNQQASLNNLENELQQQQAALQQKADESSNRFVSRRLQKPLLKLPQKRNRKLLQKLSNKHRHLLMLHHPAILLPQILRITVAVLIPETLTQEVLTPVTMLPAAQQTIVEAVPINRIWIY